MLFGLFTFTLMVFVPIVAMIQGYRIISGGDQGLVELFGRWGMQTAGMGYFGSFIFLCVVFIFFPKTFVAGTIMLGCTILFIVIMRLCAKDYSNAFTMTLYLLLIILMPVCKYPEWLSKFAGDKPTTSNLLPKPAVVCGKPAKP
jgi:hypothetical protein